MRVHYNEAKDIDLEGLENAVREHAQRTHSNLEHEPRENGTVIPFPVGGHEPHSAA